ncbi:FAD-dependent thymidylate synthase [Granulicella mallensis]|uniref:Thymidylate synthase complementing protein ThyX n=1 Tax=Granulicella mallensis (strain ATCC BAA-1857 / DSM 23137 / MP5ACTX8) TaxID=682795 RepID=G8NTS4_GRAMM|nr:FAD-dependent thymidylate synthase [Granulicella mallensis]AEU36398.1 thymidylate synthase complementing protein ThyX [Granulicella mallensis MP5ACTX8]
MSERPTPRPVPQHPENTTEVYAIHGAEPEVLAYAMAKYSRSALTLRESLAEISSQRAEQFLNTFYFQYGHRSIADLAHIPFAVEKLSLLAAICLVDETRWDGQERSTRYQDFRRSGWFTPELATKQRKLYTHAIEDLFKAYDSLSAGMLSALKRAIPQPESMKADSYERTLKARAFDAARYLLPLATNTSLGQIVNARTLETQVSRLLSSPFAEIRDLGTKLRNAASEPAWNAQRDKLEQLAGEGSVAADATTEILNELMPPVRTAPTLVKYAEKNDYQCKSRVELAQAARELMKDAPIYPAPIVDLLDDDEDLEVEIATSLVYPHCHYSYRQLRGAVASLTETRRNELLKLGAVHRGRHDELVRAFNAGHGFRFDILMDIGGFRDMHRHRRCVQLLQEFSDVHGYDEPVCPGQPTLAEAGLGEQYRDAMNAALAAYRTVCDSGEPEAKQSAQYLLPLGMRCRSLFKMDFAEALYIAELRSGIAGHFSYRRVAWEMYQAIATRHPALAGLFRIEDVNVPMDLLKR